MTRPASITILKNGPLVVKNLPSLTLSDNTGAETGDTLYLCRCGLSANKPFCDGNHETAGWSE